MTISDDPDYQRWLASRRKPSHRPPRVLIYNGASHTIDEWATILGLRPTVLRKRLSRKWTVKQTLETP